MLHSINKQTKGILLMSTKFSFTDLQVKVLSNFATINPSILIAPDRLTAMNDTNSVIGIYEYDTAFTFEPWGLYDTQDFLTIHSAMVKPEIDKIDDKLMINITGSNNDKVRYFTTAENLILPIPDIEGLFSKLDVVADFSLSADKLAIINKMASILKTKFVFFETDGKKIRITVGNELTSTGNNYEIEVDDGIKVNNLTDPIKIPILDFKVIPGEYEVKISSGATKSGRVKSMTKWVNLNNVVYYIAPDMKK
jgi:hypothetical protein